MSILSLFPLLIYGLIWGSFLTVVGLRIPLNQPIIFSRSCCPHCQHTLSSKELIPLFSILFQKGKCRHCHQSIALFYPCTEIATALLGILVFAIAQPNWLSLGSLFLVLSFGIIFSISDLTAQILPDKLMLLFLSFVCMLHFFNRTEDFFSYLISGLLFFCFFYLFYLFFPSSIGGGDVKYYGILGFLLGYQTTLFALLLACSMACIIYLPLYLSKKHNKKKPIPFAPFIFLGAYVACLSSPLFFDYLTSLLFFQ
ncbi:prepilin peptidase [Desemzia sp. RIT804]|uniref:prepilin peptidase n=1 Tax=Desemzia sp. RIT 804 TaxID=2810209 RepID=UPI0019529B55|nr:A24 family peptidase [Desemzia sp. RIT 804]MBM6615110.1 prepilin peptidase [Desemzia sp. RIT 804]